MSHVRVAPEKINQNLKYLRTWNAIYTGEPHVCCELGTRLANPISCFFGSYN